jgi:hypothetical protein
MFGAMAAGRADFGRVQGKGIQEPISSVPAARVSAKMTSRLKRHVVRQILIRKSKRAVESQTRLIGSRFG